MVDVYDLKNCNYWHCNTAIANLNFQIFCRKQTVTRSQEESRSMDMAYSLQAVGHRI